MAAAIKAAGVKALRLLFVFAASVPERVAASVLHPESTALPVVKSIGLLALLCHLQHKAALVGCRVILCSLHIAVHHIDE
jgi:hypothetical protein